MIRVIVQMTNCGAAANVGGPVVTWLKTFDIEHDEMEKLLTHKETYYHASVIGAEVKEKQP